MFLAAALFPAVAPAQSTRIVVGPDFLVSRDGDVAHVETSVAANPRNPANIVGGSIVGGRPGGGFQCKTYASHDGGQTWLDRSFPELVRFGGGDPQVVFTPSGTAIFTCLAFGTDHTGRTRAYLYAWRSEDGGLTWSSKPSDLGASYDHEMLAVDHTKGRFAGRLYLSALYGREYKLGLFRSEDDGRTWVGPVQFTDGGGFGVNVQKIIVFSDGEVLVSWVDFPIVPAQDSTWKESSYWTAVSKDGGITFSAPRKAVSLGPRYKRENPDIRLSSDPSFAVDLSDLHRDRLYMVWSNFGESGPRTTLAWSDDRGATWSAPKQINPSSPSATKEFQPRIAVNHEGTVGISYSDTRGVEGRGWHEWFTASIDGGATFLPPVRVSNEPSLTQGSGNDRLEPNVFRGTGERAGITLALISGASRWSNGGDYLGMTVDSTGAFHPLWSDARTGVFQLWTAKIRVERPPLPRKPHPLDRFFPTPAPTPLVAPRQAPIDVTKRVELVFDPTVQRDSGVVELRIRLKNISTDSIFGPVRMEVKGFGGPLDTDAVQRAPTIVNATRGGSGVGAVFDMSALLGTDQALAPGGHSSAVLVRLRLKDPRRTPSIDLQVWGLVRGPS